MRLLTAFIVLFLTLLLSACGGAGGAGGPEGVFDVNGNRLPLSTTAAASVFIDPQKSAQYTIIGGRAPFQVTSNDTQIAIASVFAGNQLSISGIADGSALITVSDVDGQKTTVAVTINVPNIAALSTTAPAAITVAVGAPANFSIRDGVPGYATSSSNAGVAVATLNANSFTVFGLSAGSADIVVSDSAGAKVSLTVTVQAPSAAALFTTAPASITLPIGMPVAYGVGGGNGTYTVTTDNFVVASASLVANTLTITGLAAGTANIVVRDSTGTTTSVAVTVAAGATVPPTPTPTPVSLFTTAPDSLTLALGQPQTYAIAGGSGPYTATSDNTSVATISLVGSNYTVNGQSAGVVNVLLRDSVGASVAVAVTVQATDTSTALFTSAPASATTAVGAPAIYSVGGGTAPYTVSSSNNTVALASLVGTTLTVNGLTAGSADVVVRDSLGATTRVTVTVPAPVAQALFTTAPLGLNLTVGTPSLIGVAGGTSPYTASSSNASVASVSLVGNILTLTGISDGNADITVTDNVAATTRIVVAVSGLAAPSLRLSPATLIIGENDSNPLTLSILGGTPPYFSITSDLLKSSVSTNGSTLTVAVGSTGNRCINPVTDATPPVYIVSGTYDVTLTVIDSLGATATSIMTIKDNGAGLNLGCP